MGKIYSSLLPPPSSLLPPLFSLLLMFGCEKPPQSYQPEPNVYCLLRTDEDTVLALVGMSAGFTDTLKNRGQWNGVSGASVKIDNVVLKELKDSLGYYLTDSLKVIAGQTCSLEVNYPNGSVVKGTTTVPDSFAITTVIVDSVEQYGKPWIEVTLNWEKSEHARGYLITGEACYKNGNYEAYWRDQSIRDSTTGSLQFPMETIMVDTIIVDFKLVEVKMEVRAVDENYYDYSRLSWWGGEADLESGMHLDGGLGVFGSAYVTERKISFKP